MRTSFTRYLPLILMLLAWYLTGCAPMTELEREDRAYAKAQWRNEFSTARDACQLQGRRFVFDRSGVSLDRNDVPRSRVYYLCT